MLSKAGRLLATIAIAYAIMVAILWSLQDRFLYPAPDRIIGDIAGFETILLETDDGLQLTARARPARDGLPTIVYFHGNGGTLLGASFATRLLNEAGYGLLLVEYRGYGGNPGSPSEQGFYRDGRAAMAWLASQGIDPAQSVFVGNSIGSGTAVQMAREFNPRALMLTAPFTSVPDAAFEALPFVPTHLLMRDQFDNAGKLADLEMPIFIMHGTDDRVVPHEHGERLAEIAPQATFVSFSGSGHALSFQQHGQEAQLAWLDQLVGAGAGT